MSGSWDRYYVPEISAFVVAFSPDDLNEHPYYEVVVESERHARLLRDMLTNLDAKPTKQGRAIDDMQEH